MSRTRKYKIVPFFIPHEGCPHLCVFCDQHSITGRSRGVKPGDILEVLRANRIHRCAPGNARPALRELAFYGGSFTCLSLNVQEAYLRQAVAARDEGLVQGIRISTRPDGIDGPVLELLMRHGVETVELGVQSMDDAVLRLSRRGHTALQSEEAVRHLKEQGFSVGVQLMPGLPGADAASDMLTTGKVIKLKPHMVRIYPTVVIRGTELCGMYLRGEYRPLGLEEVIPLSARMLTAFRVESIPVIRLGLQHTGMLESGAVVAGPHHPALRQLVESYILRRVAEQGLRSMEAEGGRALFTLSPRNLSNFRGQRNGNVRLLKETFSLNGVEVKAMPGLADDMMLLEWEGRKWEGRTRDLPVHA